MFEEKNYYELLTTHYIAAAKLLGKPFCAIVEAEADAQFWEEIFEFHTLSPDFIYSSRNPAGNKVTGVAQCLKFKEYTCSDFVICIDSDYRYLTGDPDISPDKFIFQTYTHSIENHYCHHTKFNDVCRASCSFPNEIFNFRSFSEQYSKTLFPLFLWHICSIRYARPIFSQSDFLRIINESHEGVPKCDIKNNGKMIIERLDKSCKEKLTELETEYPDIDLDNEKLYLSTLDVTEQNVSLYIRGHDMFLLTRKIGENVVNEILEKEKLKMKDDPLKIKGLYETCKPFQEKLREGRYSTVYNEIERIFTDITISFAL